MKRALPPGPQLTLGLLSGLLLSGLLFSGCLAPCGGVACGACISALTLRIGVAAGSTLPEASEVAINESTGGCYLSGDRIECMVDGNAGTITLEVTAPGFESQSLEVVIPPDGGGCCACGYEPQTRDLVLVP